MPIDRRTWKIAILRVLKAAVKPLDCNAIIQAIREGEHRKITGATPDRTVASQLANLVQEGQVKRTQPGFYSLLERNDKETEITEEADQHKPFSIKACGLYWDREKVQWYYGQRELWGQRSPHALSVNFANQIGIYLLHNWQEIVYVGTDQKR